MSEWHEPCASQDRCTKPNGSNTAPPTHKCVECKHNVHVCCSSPVPDPNASFGEGHICFQCKLPRLTPRNPAGEVPPPQPPQPVVPTALTRNGEDPSPPPAAPEDRFREDPDSWIMPTHKTCHPHLVKLMSFCHSSEFEKNTIFTRDHLLKLTPVVIKCWLSKMAHGKEVHDANNDNPTFARSSTLEQAKKAVSFFMPNKNPQWCNGQGNPTKHSDVTQVIKDVKKAEVRGLGRPSQAKRPLREPEFRKTLELLAEVVQAECHRLPDCQQDDKRQKTWWPSESSLIARTLQIGSHPRRSLTTTSWCVLQESHPPHTMAAASALSCSNGGTRPE